MAERALIFTVWSDELELEYFKTALGYLGPSGAVVDRWAIYDAAALLGAYRGQAEFVRPFAVAIENAIQVMAERALGLIRPRSRLLDFCKTFWSKARLN